MRRTSKFVPALLLVVSLCWAGVVGCGEAPTRPAKAPRNIILLIGDGMGLGTVEAAGMYANGQGGTLSFVQLPYKSTVVTTAIRGDITDSAAAATAMATGHKVNNGVLSMARPGDGSDLRTILEISAAAGKKTGLASTRYLEDATLAAFTSHVAGRAGYNAVADGYLKDKPNLIMGAYIFSDPTSKKPTGLLPAKAKQAGYTLVSNRSEMQALKPGQAELLACLFTHSVMGYEYDYAQGKEKDYDTMPHLSEIAAKAVELLAAEPKGFFLMVEGGTIDSASHPHETERALAETVEFSKAVAAVMAWAKDRDDTLVIVTADHETGGMKVVKNNGKGEFPTVEWTAPDHTNAKVGLWAWGVGAEAAALARDNTDIFKLMTGTLTAETAGKPAPNPASRPATSSAPALVPAGAGM